jgi:hypothetical protein
VLHQLADAQCTIEVFSDYLNNWWNIHHVVVKSLKAGQEEGQGNYQAFEMEAWASNLNITGGSLKEV